MGLGIRDPGQWPCMGKAPPSFDLFRCTPLDKLAMASSRGRAKSVEKKRVESRLVDTHTKQSHRLEEGGRLLIGMPFNRLYDSVSDDQA